MTASLLLHGSVSRLLKQHFVIISVVPGDITFSVCLLRIIEMSVQQLEFSKLVGFDFGITLEGTDHW